MMLEPAQCAGDAPRTAPEQGMPVAPSPAAPPAPGLSTPDVSTPGLSTPGLSNSEPPTPHHSTPHPPPPAAAAVAPSTDAPSLADPAAVDPDHATRLPTPAPDARRRAEREQWMRRRRLERQLHDGAALRISALSLQLGLFRHRVPDGEPDLHASIDSLQDELHAVLQELRDVAGKIYPSLLDEAGLGPALREAADRLELPIRVDAPADRFGPAAEGAAYYAVVESLVAENAAVGDRHAGGPDRPSVEVLVRRAGDEPDAGVLAVELRGVNVAHAGAMLDQVRRLGGTIDVAGGPGPGTITARIPCE